MRNKNIIKWPARTKALVLYASATLFMFCAAYLTAKLSIGYKKQSYQIQHFQKKILRKEHKLDVWLDKLIDSSKLNSYNELFEKNTFINSSVLNDEGFSLLIYESDSLRFWTDNLVPVGQRFLRPFQRSKLIHLRDGYYLSKIRQEEDKVFIGLALIKHEYPYENRFIKNTYQKDFNLSASYTLSVNPLDMGEIVVDAEGDYLFTLNDSESVSAKRFQLILTGLLYLITLILFLITLRALLWVMPKNELKKWTLLFEFFLLLGIMLLLTDQKLPLVIYNLALFQPHHFATPSFFNSLGEFLIAAIFIFYFCYSFFKDYEFHTPKISSNRYFYILLTVFYITVVYVFFISVEKIIHLLVVNSTISFEPYRILSLSLYSFIGFLIIALLLGSLALFIEKYYHLFKGTHSFFLLLTIHTVVLGSICFSNVFSHTNNINLVVFYVVLSGYSYGKIYYRLKIRYSFIILIGFVISVYTTSIVLHSSRQKEKNQRKVFAMNMAAEHDPVAEYLLEDIGRKLSGDESLAILMRKFSFTGDEVQKILDYLLRYYFHGFWDRYDVRITLCSPESNLSLMPDNEIVSCYEFFHKMAEEDGEKVTSRNFYYLGDEDTRIRYFGIFTFPFLDGEFENSLFISLDAKLFSEQLGYPELLIEGKYERRINLKEYSYAKYKHGTLVNYSGSYVYPSDPDVFTVNKEFEYQEIEEYDHLFYCPDDHTMIVVSFPKVKVVDALVSFSYFFLLFFFFSTALLLLGNSRLLKKSLKPTIRNKIQFSLIAILFLSILFIGSGTVYYSIRQYKIKNYENIREKIQSVFIELDHKLAFEEKLTPQWHGDNYNSLDELLIKFSNVFYTDINLYDLDGNLLATSREEIFRQGLMGKRMDPVAYKQLVLNQKIEFLQEEQIGEMNYLSAYVPFRNSENQLLAYLNLPYFTKQGDFTQEVSTLVVTVVNIYVLLILISLFFAVIISKQLTRPLKLIQRKFREIKLGRKTELMHYDRKDELGDLVNEYNLMVEKLAKSIEKLAQTERETAWRGMARQIAHEIKNPLTPMKLSVQYLVKSWKDEVPDWEARLDKVAETLIEQIDNLSFIATEFSNFAKMPKAQNEQVNIVEKLRNTISLFANSGNVEILLELNNIEEAYVYADKEQLIRVFNNLIKNAMQSIPRSRKGKIQIILGSGNGMVHIEVRDNGTGVPNELKNQLFLPNFTTKSSGMGLGLSIVKNIIEAANGRIWFETKLGDGTSFFVELPESEMPNEDHRLK